MASLQELSPPHIFFSLFPMTCCFILDFTFVRNMNNVLCFRRRRKYFQLVYGDVGDVGDECVDDDDGDVGDVGDSPFPMNILSH